jgi:hypothetical protein
MNATMALHAGWISILTGFLAGTAMGAFYRNDARLGGYSSKARRYVRLGHIACEALGMIVILAALCTKLGYVFPDASLLLLVIGMISMPISCWVTAFWEKGFYLFPIPSFSLSGAVVLMLIRQFGGSHA